MKPKEKPTPQFSQDAIEALYASGFSLYESGKYVNAVHFFRFLTLIDMNTRKHWMGLGASHQMLKEYENALQSFGYAALLNENDPYAHFHAAECFFALKQTDQGEQALASAETVALRQQKQYETLLARISLIKEKE